ncbi:hypothetical protein R1flu_011983 [Riccia fluitans]|uniref:Uncharacterized protein n=1 Tax=Riccia fluitans TaxID=41844 RepID=A0ABD1Z9C0_9MARC
MVGAETVTVKWDAKENGVNIPSSSRKRTMVGAETVTVKWDAKENGVNMCGSRDDGSASVNVRKERTWRVKHERGMRTVKTFASGTGYSSGAEIWRAK